MSIDVSQYVDVSSEIKSFVLSHMLSYKEKGVKYKCITSNCVVNILSMYSSGCLDILLTVIYWINS